MRSKGTRLRINIAMTKAANQRGCARRNSSPVSRCRFSRCRFSRCRFKLRGNTIRG
jgi:hypothetical protein